MTCRRATEAELWQAGVPSWETSRAADELMPYRVHPDGVGPVGRLRRASRESADDSNSPEWQRARTGILEDSERYSERQSARQSGRESRESREEEDRQSSCSNTAFYTSHRPAHLNLGDLGEKEKRDHLQRSSEHDDERSIAGESDLAALPSLPARRGSLIMRSVTKAMRTSIVGGCVDSTLEYSRRVSHAAYPHTASNRLGSELSVHVRSAFHRFGCAGPSLELRLCRHGE